MYLSTQRLPKLPLSPCILAVAVLVALGSAGCGSGSSGLDTCTDASECADGLSCVSGFCLMLPPRDAGPDQGQPPADMGTPPVDLGVRTDAGRSDMGVIVLPMPELPNYLGCDRDADCPVGFGRCLTQLTYNVPDANGETTVSVRSLDPERTRDGICTLPCTDDATVCGSLALRLGDSGPAPFTCQVVALGVSPYPSVSGGFPLTVDVEAMSAGQAFAAVCRPPFDIDASHSDSLCAACSDDDACQAGDLCWNSGTGLRGDAGVAGECLEPCTTDADCVFGFSCDALEEDVLGTPTAIGTYCVPTVDTCGACLDADADGRGAGLCADGGTATTTVDCDDAEPDAYYDPLDPTHPFPTYCGTFDMNCNGRADDTEQFVSADHCGGCNQPCAGALASGGPESAQRQCQQDGTCGLACDSPTTQADCDGDLDNGCEVAVVDPARLVYLDNDEDGDGTPNTVASPRSPLFTCTPGDTPPGYSVTATDCNDSDSTVGGVSGQDVQCDGVNQDCDGATDEGYAPVACTTNQLGRCAPGTTACSLGNATCVRNNNPVFETCTNLATDDDCDGIGNEAKNASNVDVVLGSACTASGAIGSCRNGAWGCAGVGATALCLAGSPTTDAFGNNVDENCDGVDGDASDTVFVSTTGSDGAAGTAAAPFRTIGFALSRAVALGRSTVRVAGGAYTRTAGPLVLQPGITIIGGHQQAQGWQIGGPRTSLTVSTVAIRNYTASAGLYCNSPVADNAANRGGLTGIDVSVVRRTSGATGESVIGGWFDTCPWLRFSNSTLTVASAAAGANNTTAGGAGTTGGTGTMGGARRSRERRAGSA
jgi:hypothetical protein